MPEREVRSSKEERFTETYNTCFRSVYSFVLARTAGSRQMAEEIVQETFAAVWQSPHLFKEHSSYTTYLCGIAKNKLREQYRKRATAERFANDSAYLGYDLADNFNSEAIAISGETAQEVQKALTAIPEIYRYALVMKYIDECSVKEIARVLRRTPKAVDGLLQRAKSCFLKAYRKEQERP